MARTAAELKAFFESPEYRLSTLLRLILPPERRSALTEEEWDMLAQVLLAFGCPPPNPSGLWPNSTV